MIHRSIPSSNELLPVIGLGTYQTFDVPAKSIHPALNAVLDTFHEYGGTLIDSSPMYGRAEQVVGDITSGMAAANNFFYATKVWTTGLQAGIQQMESSRQKMKREVIDLMQIHNLTDWETHLPTLRRWKEEGKIRYIGITHYKDSSHEALEKVMRTEKLDFVQFNYSIFARHAEERLLAAAADLGVATIINLPFGEGRHFQQVKNKDLPPWAFEFDIHSWGAFFLKYIISHPAVTCVIPATANPRHALENMQAGSGSLPDAAMRNKMVEYLQK